jgi:predicted HTH transcriptional regulator
MLNVPEDLSLTDGQRAILEAALRHPEETNRELAERTATRVATVRDTREAYAGRVELADERTTTLTMPTDSASFNAAETAILEATLEDPLRTNAEIAELTGTRVALVRDTREAYEDRVERADIAGDDGEDDDVVAEEGEHTEAERAILAAVASNPKRTNAEIAAETGARMALVRDTREAHAGSIEASEGDDAGDEAAGGESAADASLSGLQREILETAADEPTLTNAEIAERTGARITLVRDTREAHA